MKFFDTFTGIGGFTIPLLELGYECVGFSEIDKYAIKVYKQHFPNHKNYGDITKINAHTLPDFDILCGGFPCQAFSIAGKRRGFDDTRGTLFFDVARICKEKKPRLVFLENVKGLLNHDNGRTFKTIIATLTELGYDVQWQVLNSKNFGVPQNRERIFIIGYLAGTSRREVFPFRENNQKIIELQGQQIVANTIRARYEAQGGGAYIIERKQHSQIERINNPIHSNNRVYNPLGLAPSLNTAQGGNRQPKILLKDNNSKGYSEAIPGDGIRTQFPDSKTARGRVVKQAAQAAQAIQASGAPSVLLKDYRIRRLTPIECERLQAYEDDWTNILSDSRRYKALGNSVTVEVIRQIAKRL